MVSVGKKHAEGGHVFEMPDACPSCGAGYTAGGGKPPCGAQTLNASPRPCKSRSFRFARRYDIDGMGRCCAPAGGKGFVHNGGCVFFGESQH